MDKNFDELDKLEEAAGGIFAVNPEELRRLLGDRYEEISKILGIRND